MNLFAEIEIQTKQPNVLDFDRQSKNKTKHQPIAPQPAIIIPEHTATEPAKEEVVWLPPQMSEAEYKSFFDSIDYTAATVGQRQFRIIAHLYYDREDGFTGDGYKSSIVEARTHDAAAEKYKSYYECEADHDIIKDTFSDFHTLVDITIPVIIPLFRTVYLKRSNHSINLPMLQLSKRI